MKPGREFWGRQVPLQAIVYRRLTDMECVDWRTYLLRSRFIGHSKMTAESQSRWGLFLCLPSCTWWHISTKQISVCALASFIRYAISLSAGNAKIEGLLPSLNMDGIQYNIALSIFFIPYILAGMSKLACTDPVKIHWCSWRGAEQFDFEPIQETVTLFGISDILLGHNYALYGICWKLLRSSSGSLPIGSIWVYLPITINRCFGTHKYSELDFCPVPSSWFRNGIFRMRHRPASPFFTHLPLLGVPSQACWHLPLPKWMVRQVTKAGAGFVFPFLFFILTD